MPHAIELIGASKKYGKFEALKNVSFAIEKGSLVAMLGPNGAGKTTSINLMLGLRRPTAGKALIFGNDGLGGVHQDGHDTIKWIASQEWSNGKIGTYGGSGHAAGTLVGVLVAYFGTGAVETIDWEQ